MALGTSTQLSSEVVSPALGRGIRPRCVRTVRISWSEGARWRRCRGSPCPPASCPRSSRAGPASDCSSSALARQIGRGVCERVRVRRAQRNRDARKSPAAALRRASALDCHRESPAAASPRSAVRRASRSGFFSGQSVSARWMAAATGARSKRVNRLVIPLHLLRAPGAGALQLDPVRRVFLDRGRFGCPASARRPRSSASSASARSRSVRRFAFSRAVERRPSRWPADASSPAALLSAPGHSRLAGTARKSAASLSRSRVDVGLRRLDLCLRPPSAPRARYRSARARCAADCPDPATRTQTIRTLRRTARNFNVPRLINVGLPAPAFRPGCLGRSSRRPD